MTNRTGFNTTYRGTLREVVAKERSNNANTKTWVENLVICEHISNDGVPIITSFKLSRAAMDAGMFSKLQSLKGKDIAFAVTSKHRAWDGKVYTDHFFSQTELPKQVQQPQAA